MYARSSDSIPTCCKVKHNCPTTSIFAVRSVLMRDAATLSFYPLMYFQPRRNPLYCSPLDNSLVVSPHALRAESMRWSALARRLAGIVSTCQPLGFTITSKTRPRGGYMRPRVVSAQHKLETVRA
jgi:hypothetical protein